jgi:hypothetical protein
VAAGQRFVHLLEPQSDNLQTTALEAADDFADQTSLDGIWFYDNEGAFHFCLLLNSC